MSWFYLALLAPLLFAIVNLIDDNLINHVYKSSYYGAIISGLFGAAPLVGLLVRPLTQTSTTVAIVGILAGFFTTIYYFFYFRALETESPSVVIAMFGLSPVLILILANVFLGEQLFAKQIIGFAVILFASLALGLAEIKRFKFSKALILVLIAATIYAVAALFSKYTFIHTDFYTGFMYFSGGMGLGGIYFLLVLRFLKETGFIREIRRNSKKVLILFVIAEAIAIVAELTQSLAISRGPVSLVKAIEGIQPIYVLVIALIFYRFSPKHFREAAEGGLVKKIALMIVGIIGLFLIHATT